MRLSVKAMTLTGGIVWGFFVFGVTWWVIVREGISGDPTWLGRIYPGYSISPLGSVIGLGWAFVDGCIAGALVSWLYNLLARRLDGGTPA